MMHSRVRRGLALTELLATVAIVAVLLALLLPASQQNGDGFVNRGGGGIPAPIEVVPAPPPSLAAVLDEIVQKGELGSRVESLRAAIEQIERNDPERGLALLDDLHRLQTVTDPDAVTELAAAMATK